MLGLARIEGTKTFQHADPDQTPFDMPGKGEFVHEARPVCTLALTSALELCYIERGDFASEEIVPKDSVGFVFGNSEHLPFDPAGNCRYPAAPELFEVPVSYLNLRRSAPDG